MSLVHAETASHNSTNGLRRIIDSTPRQRKLQILDLGPPKRRKFDMLQMMAPCRIHVRDISDFCLNTGSSESTLKGKGQDCQHELNFEDGVQFDVVFAWDVLNYLDRSRLVGLMSHIGSYCRDGAFLYAILATGNDMPSRPHQFDIENDNRIVFYPKNDGGMKTISGPGYPPSEFQSLLPRFQVMHMFQLANRYQEHLYSFDSFKPYRKLRFA